MSAASRPLSQNTTTIVTVTIASDNNAKATSADTQMTNSINRYFSSRSSSANNSMRFCAVARRPPASRRNDPKIPGEDSGESSIMVPSIHQHADQYADAERDADRLIRMLANCPVRGSGARDGFFLQRMERFLGRFQSGR